MKRFLLYLLMILALVSCQKDPEIPIVKLTVQDKVEAEWLTANLSGSASSNATVEDLFVQLSTDEGFGTITEIQATYNNGQFAAVLTNLTPQTTYYYRYRVANKLNTYTDSKVQMFNTKDYVAPIVTTDAVTHITGKKANIYGTLVFDCCKEIKERGFEIGTNKNNLVKMQADDKTFSLQLTTLHFGTKYFYRAYATSDIGTGYGETKTFTTCDVVKFGTIKVSDITINSATAEYTITSNGGMSVLKQGMQYWKKGTKNYTNVETSKTATFTNLTKDQTYQLLAFAETEDSCFYSAVSEFTTSNGVITLTTTTPSNVSYTSATLGGQITDDGGATISERGVCWSTQSNPTTANSKKTASGNTFSVSVSNLNNVTKYYVRAYAVNQFGTYYGTEKTFTTIAYTKPTITTSNVTNLSYTSATCGGNVTDNGGVTITERGICFATTTNPTISNTKVTSGTGTGSFSCNLTGLTAGTTYYVRAYATNSKGTSYGSTNSFITSTYTKPTITTINVSNISYTSATCGGNVTADGGQNVTERGVCYATTSSPTTSNIKITSGSGTGSFSCNLSGLTEGTTYYVRAYAINNKGTSYGVVKSFSTKSTSGTEAGHEWVDLGLSVKWATMNLGATKETGYGNYYAWGETSTKTNYSWSTYKYCNGSVSTITKYCIKSNYGTIDYKTMLEASDDAAHVNWGGNWRMPTKAEQEELCNNCTLTWTDDYKGTGIAGRIFTSNKTGYTNKSIFLPAAGWYYQKNFNNVNVSAEYWSAELNNGLFSQLAGIISFDSDEATSIYYSLRSNGCSVRPVCP